MRKLGDRKDAKKVRNLDGLHNVMIDIKPERCDSDVYMNKEIDVTKLIKYVEKNIRKNILMIRLHTFMLLQWLLLKQYTINLF
ncbi:MAG: hypothetical protein L6V81_09350 [Clostridium sp.]|nr:MAG: hypothetical protein L6V81_09350 [Clostridium sp.]